MLKAIGAELARSGAQVRVLCGQPAYTPRRSPRLPAVRVEDGVEVHRRPWPYERSHPAIRALNGLRLAATVIATAVRWRPDVVMVSTVPPVLGGVAGRWAARLSGARFWYHCMDLQPEIGQLSGDFGTGGLSSGLARLEARTCREADLVIVLSPDMQQSVRRRAGCDDARLEVINNFSLPQTSGPVADLPAVVPGARFRLLFAGNLGRFQGLETVVDAMHLVAAHRQDVELVLMGEGLVADSLRSRAAAGPARELIEFVPPQNEATARSAMRAATVGLVTLAPGVYRYAYPSKTMTYLSEGCPLLVMVEPDSDLARQVLIEGVGVVVAPGDAAALATAIEALADDADTSGMRGRAKALAEREYEPSAVLPRWAKLLRELT
jgi:glycosyltransferase involved in cell wall biosynthesis